MTEAMIEYEQLHMSGCDEIERRVEGCIWTMQIRRNLAASGAIPISIGARLRRVFRL